MAGPDPSGEFDPDEFRADIRAAMLMGMPQATELRPTFHFAGTETFAQADSAGVPFDFTAAPTGGDPPPEPVQVLCTVEVKPGSDDETSVGVFDASELLLGFFEDEWAAVEQFKTVDVGGRRFVRGKQYDINGLYDVTFRRIEVAVL